MRLYVAGPMTGYPHFNIPAFDAMAAELRANGHEVISPAELDDPDDRAAALASPDGSALHYGSDALRKQTWGDFLARDVKLLADDGIEGVVVLPGWNHSRGALLETYVARMLCGIGIYRWTKSGLTRIRLLELGKAWLQKTDISFASPAEEPIYEAVLR